MANRRLLLSLIFFLLLCSSAAAQTTPPVELKPGLPAPELALTKMLQAPPDAKVDWKSLRGKVVILEFWATWCAPCIAVQPHLNDLIEKFKGKPVQLISITNEDENKVASFLRRRTLKGWVGLDLDRSAQNSYWALALPKTVIVDPQGNIVAEPRATDLTAEMLDQILAGTFTRPTSGTAKEQPAETTTTKPPVAGKPNELERDLITLNLKPSKASPLTMMGGGPGKFEATGVDLKSVFSYLLRVAKPLIYLPIGVNEDRYDIRASILNDKKQNLNPLVVNALEIALNLKVKHETREIEVFVLTAPKSLTGSLQPSISKAFHASADKGVLAAESADIRLLVRDLENLLEAPIVNEAGLSGKYDWDLTFEDGNRPSLIDAVHNQFGLVLTREKRPVEVVVIEANPT